MHFRCVQRLEYRRNMNGGVLGLQTQPIYPINGNLHCETVLWCLQVNKHQSPGLRMAESLRYLGKSKTRINRSLLSSKLVPSIESLDKFSIQNSFQLESNLKREISDTLFCSVFYLDLVSDFVLYFFTNIALLSIQIFCETISNVDFINFSVTVHERIAF